MKNSIKSIYCSAVKAAARVIIAVVCPIAFIASFLYHFPKELINNLR